METYTTNTIRPETINMAPDTLLSLFAWQRLHYLLEPRNRRELKIHNARNTVRLNGGGQGAYVWDLFAVRSEHGWPEVACETEQMSIARVVQWRFHCEGLLRSTQGEDITNFPHESWRQYQVAGVQMRCRQKKKERSEGGVGWRTEVNSTEGKAGVSTKGDKCFFWTLCTLQQGPSSDPDHWSSRHWIIWKAVQPREWVRCSDHVTVDVCRVTPFSTTAAMVTS